MPLTLVTGPANAAKAGAVLGPLRERVHEQPILVVPSFEAVEHSQRELAERGAVFGTRVLRTGALFELVAERAGLAARRASELQRLLLVEEAVGAAGLRVLAASAERPGFARAAVRFFGELESSMIEPPRFTRAMRDWTGDGPRRAYADEVAGLYRRYREGLEAAGLLDDDLFGWRALDALRRDPASWGATPVFVYGFDDFENLMLDALDTLARHADVTVSLPYEPGREAFRATAGIREELVARGAEVVHLEAVSEHYAPSSRQALHALERRLYEQGGGRLASGGAVRLHAAGGERAEIELCGAEVLAALREGTPPGEIAVVFRDPGSYASMLEQVFGAYGIPYSIDRSVPLAHTSLGRGLLALLRCAALGGSAEDLLAYLRTPGRLRVPGLADSLEARVRREAARSAAQAQRIWEEEMENFALEEIDRLSGAPDMAALLAELDRRLQQLFAGPYRRRAHVLEGAELDDPRAFRAAHDALEEMAAVAPGLSAQRVHDTLAQVPVRVGEGPQPDRVQVASPLAIRARRFQAVFVCGLQEGEFPRGARPEAFLPDADRRELARASGVALPLREVQLERERYLFYVCASRAERRLVLSSRYCDEEGNPQAPSFLLEDVRAVFSDLDEHTRRRALADVAWSLEQAPTPAEWERAVALRGPRVQPRHAGPITEPAARERLAAREAVSAGALEHFAGCPVRWLVEDVLRPQALEPDAEELVRGSFSHRVLELTFSRLRERTGERRVSAANLAEAEGILAEALEETQEEFRLAPDRARVRAAVLRLEHALRRYLRHEAGRDGVFEPEHLELRFGFADSDHPAVELLDGLRVRGKIDRVDTWNGHALVRDYKSGRVDSYKASDWEGKHRLQAALYMLVVHELLGLSPAGGVYTPLGGPDRRSRGLVAEELSGELGSDFFANDVLDEEGFSGRTGWARGAIAEVAEGMREGRLEPCPGSCAYRGGCAHPSICRVEE